MLYNKEGKKVSLDQHWSDYARAQVHEVLEPLPPHCGTMFRLSERARLINHVQAHPHAQSSLEGSNQE